MEGFIVFATEEGGRYHAMRGTHDDYRAAIERGTVPSGNVIVGGVPTQERVTYLAWCEFVEDWDVILGRPR